MNLTKQIRIGAVRSKNYGWVTMPFSSYLFFVGGSTYRTWQCSVLWWILFVEVKQPRVITGNI